MPYLGIEFHLWWLEWIVWWNIYVHIEDSSFVASVFLFIKKNLIKIRLWKLVKGSGNQINSFEELIDRFVLIVFYTYWSKYFAFPVSEIIANNLCFDDLLTLGL